MIYSGLLWHFIGKLKPQKRDMNMLRMLTINTMTMRLIIINVRMISARMMMVVMVNMRSMLMIMGMTVAMMGVRMLPI
ncbi:MAG: hypothetical protein R3C11_16065 [Planctomycetaceae bacterium]